MTELEELREMVAATLSARPHLVSDPPVWLMERGWVEEDVRSSIRWRSPHTNTLHGAGEAMHIERFLLRERLKDMVGFDEDALKNKRREARRQLKKDRNDGKEDERK